MSLKRVLSNFAVRVLAPMPQSLLGAIERVVQNAQGKGWGAATMTHEVTAIRQLIGDLGDGSVVFDVGANRGEWTALFLTIFPAVRIRCFEPSSMASSLLTKRFAENSSVMIERIALSDEIGTQTLWSDEPGSGLASLIKRDLSQFGIDYSTEEVVQVSTLDRYCEQSKLNPLVIKFDVEGAELKALNGGRKVLANAKIVQFEFGGTNIDSRTYFRDFFHFFAEMGFKIYRLGPKGLTLVAVAREEDEVFRVTNYFALRD